MIVLVTTVPSSLSRPLCPQQVLTTLGEQHGGGDTVLAVVDFWRMGRRENDLSLWGSGAVGQLHGH